MRSAGETLRGRAGLGGKRIGETMTMRCGLTAEIVGYRSASDMTVRFPDGSEREHVSYAHFKAGQVLPDARGRVGETAPAANGLTAEITEYNGSLDVTVRFSNGKVRSHVTYQQFKSGRLPDEPQRKKKARMRLEDGGQVVRVLSMDAEGTAAVLMEDGSTREGVPAGGITVSAESGKKEPGGRKNWRLGERRMMRCGLEAEITGYTSASDMTVRFSDGSAVAGASYYKFSRGLLSPGPRAGREGERRKMRCGAEAEVYKYFDSHHIIVRFDGGGFKACSYQNFRSGRVLPPAPGNGGMDG